MVPNEAISTSVTAPPRHIPGGGRGETKSSHKVSLITIRAAAEQFGGSYQTAMRQWKLLAANIDDS